MVRLSESEKSFIAERFAGVLRCGGSPGRWVDRLARSGPLWSGCGRHHGRSRCRSERHLSLAEREEISRGLVAGMFAAFDRGGSGPGSVDGVPGGQPQRWPAAVSGARAEAGRGRVVGARRPAEARVLR